MTDSHDLGHDSQRQLFGAAPPEVETYRSTDSGQLLVRDPLLLQGFDAFGVCLLGAQGTNIGNSAFEGDAERRQVDFEVMREQD